MAFQQIVRHRAVPVTAMAAGLALYPKRTAHAESPESYTTLVHRKPIYDTSEGIETSPQRIHATTVTSEPPSLPPKTSPVPTDRLAAQIKKSRVFLHSYAVSLENGVDDIMTRFLKMESSFTSTIRSLAPPRESGEKLLPGGIYVLVAAMAGSIVARNRNILLRAIVPVATGVGAGYAVLPITTRNVGNLVWSYEERYPVIRDNHLRVSNGIRHFYETGKAHSQMGLAMAEDKVEGVGKSLEDWVKKGK